MLPNTFLNIEFFFIIAKNGKFQKYVKYLTDSKFESKL